MERITLIVMAKRVLKSPKTTRYASVDVASGQKSLIQQVSSLQFCQTLFYIVIPFHYTVPSAPAGFFFEGRANREPRPEGLRSEARRAEVRWSSWRAVASPSHQLGGLRERSKLSERGPGRIPGENRLFVQFLTSR